jgi:hypothetical protein
MAYDLCVKELKEKGIEKLRNLFFIDRRKRLETNTVSLPLQSHQNGVLITRQPPAVRVTDRSQ